MLLEVNLKILSGVPTPGKTRPDASTIASEYLHRYTYDLFVIYSVGGSGNITLTALVPDSSLTVKV